MSDEQKKATYKPIWVDPKTHALIKRMALEKEMTMKDYIKLVVEQDVIETASTWGSQPRNMAAEDGSDE